MLHRRRPGLRLRPETDLEAVGVIAVGAGEEVVLDEYLDFAR